ncbi:DUF4129 domain-containing protein [Actinoplanes sp. GCM10030250]|uniref:DUF4129 domain-containing protein n=1 Tax=Actinoplanes sp. GCM10030250 TaxID=3273376 RepID=UPI003616219A
MRGYDELVASVLDVVPPPLMLLLLFGVTVLTAVLWYTYPAWLRFRLPRFRRPRLRLPRLRLSRFRRRAKPVIVAESPTVEITPDAGARTVSLADRLAAQGRYAEAIRERLRETVSDLTRAGVIQPEPGWTAAELSALAAANRPPLGPALGGATELFSQVWYGRLDARADEDERMRRLTGDVRAALGAFSGGGR